MMIQGMNITHSRNYLTKIAIVAIDISNTLMNEIAAYQYPWMI
jgi:hypothetical protein